MGGGWGGRVVLCVGFFFFVNENSALSSQTFASSCCTCFYLVLFVCFFFHLLHNANETNVSSPFRALKKQTHYCQQLFQCNLILQNSFNSTCKFVVLLLLRGSVHMQCKQFNFIWLSGVLNFHLCITSVHS